MGKRLQGSEGRSEGAKREAMETKAKLGSSDQDRPSERATDSRTALGVGKGMGRGFEALRMALRTFSLVKPQPAQESQVEFGHFGSKPAFSPYPDILRYFSICPLCPIYPDIP